MCGLIVPSYANGYATCAAEAQYPELWSGLLGAWIPWLGVSNDLLLDVSGNKNHGSIISTSFMGPMASINWFMEAGRPNVYYYPSIAPVTCYTLLDRKVQTNLPCTVSVWFKTNTTATGNLVLLGNSGYSGDYIYLNKDYTGFTGISTSVSASLNVGGTFNDNRWHNDLFRVWPNSGGMLPYARRDTGDWVGDTGITSGSSDFGFDAIGYTNGSASFFAFIGPVLFWDRILSEDECNLQYHDPYALVRLKDDVSTTSVYFPWELTRKGRIAYVETEPVQPSYANGYATCAAESAHPELWRGLVGAWCPYLGVSGSEVPSLTKSYPPASFIGNASWDDDDGTVVGGAYLGYLSVTSGNTPDPIAGARQVSMVANVKCYSDISRKYLMHNVWTSTSTRLRMELNSTEQLEIGARSTATDTQREAVSGAVADGWRSIVGLVDFAGGSIKGYVDAVEVCSSSNAFAQTKLLHSAFGGPFNLLSNGSGSSTFESNVKCFLIYNRALSSAEIQLLYRDPFALTRLRTQVPYVPGDTRGTVLRPRIVSAL